MTLRVAPPAPLPNWPCGTVAQVIIHLHPGHP